METLINTIKEAIEKENWNIAYHQEQVDKATEKRGKLSLELAGLVLMLSDKDQHKTFHEQGEVK